MNSQKISLEWELTFYTSGELTPQTKQVIILFHGYGQTADSYYNNLKDSLPKNAFIIIPEAPHYFYLKGINGDIGASWMTSRHRELAIKNQLNYLDRLWELFKNKIPSNAKIHGIAFSQGCSTLGRWIEYGDIQWTSNQFWCSLPQVEFQQLKAKSLSTKLFLGIGDKLASQYLKTDQLKKWETNFPIVYFEGKHEIEKNIVKNEFF